MLTRDKVEMRKEDNAQDVKGSEGGFDSERIKAPGWRNLVDTEHVTAYIETLCVHFDKLKRLSGLVMRTATKYESVKSQHLRVCYITAPGKPEKLSSANGL